MLTILIVDDEYRDRQGMANIINRQDWSVKTFEAKGCRAALEILQTETVDILITDIRMPDMLGTELAEQAVKLQPALKIIFISAYKDFEYVQQALRTGAVNYLLKPYLIEDFIAAVDGAIKKCLSEQSAAPGRDSYNRFDQVSRDWLIGAVLENRDDTALQQRFEDVVGGISGGVQPVMIEILGNKSDIAKLPLHTVFSEVFEHEMPFFCLNRKRCLLLLQDATRFFPSEDLAKHFTEDFKLRAETEVCVVYGRTVHEMQELFREYDCILATLEIGFFIDSSTVIAADENERFKFENELQLSSLIDRIGLEVRLKDYDSVLSDLRFLFDYFKQTNHLSPLYVKYISSNIINRIFLNMNVDNIETHMQTWLKKIFEIQSVYDVYSVFEELIDSIRGADNSNANSQLINNIYYLIDTEYMHDLTLESVAKQLYISPSYLSHLFKRETGENFIDYLKNYRLQKSCELLKTTNLRIAKICNKIGYESPSYYCSLFKSTYGMTPTQYRKRSYKNDL